MLLKNQCNGETQVLGILGVGWLFLLKRGMPECHILIVLLPGGLRKLACWSAVELKM